MFAANSRRLHLALQLGWPTPCLGPASRDLRGILHAGETKYKIRRGLYDRVLFVVVNVVVSAVLTNRFATTTNTWFNSTPDFIIS